jgi:hypothetical protein
MMTERPNAAVEDVAVAFLRRRHIVAVLTCSALNREAMSLPAEERCGIIAHCARDGLVMSYHHNYFLLLAEPSNSERRLKACRARWRHIMGE